MKPREMRVLEVVQYSGSMFLPQYRTRWGRWKTFQRAVFGGGIVDFFDRRYEKIEQAQRYIEEQAFQVTQKVHPPRRETSITFEAHFDPGPECLLKESDTDGERCVRCGGVGQDRRTLVMSCGAAMIEPDDPTMPDIPFFRLYEPGQPKTTKAPYTLRVCKQCRADWIAAIGQWFTGGRNRA